MGKRIFWACFCLFCVMILCVGGIIYSIGAQKWLITTIQATEEAIKSKDAARFDDALQTLFAQWNKVEEIESSYLQHNEFDAVRLYMTELKAIAPFRQWESCLIACSKLRQALEHFSSVELPTIENIM